MATPSTASAGVTLPLHLADTTHARVLRWLSGVLSQLLHFPAFAAHAELLVHDKQLCSGLLKLLLPAIPAAAVGLQLPLERRQSDCTWRAVARTAFAVSFLGTAAARVLPSMLADDSGAAMRLLHAAAQLLQRCPLPATSGDPVADAFDTTIPFVCQLGTIAGALKLCRPDQQQQAPLAHAGMGAAAAATEQHAVLPLRLAQQLLALLPRFAEAMAAASQLPITQMPQLTSVLYAAHSVLRLLAGTTEQQAGSVGMAAADEQPAWLRGAAAALQWLPVIAALVERQQPLPEQVAAEYNALMASHAAELAVLALRLAGRVASGGYVAFGKSEPRLTSHELAALADCLDAWWQFHTAACRLVHWTQACSTPPVMRAALKGAPPVMADVLQYQLGAACAVFNAHPSPPPPSMVR